MKRTINHSTDAVFALVLFGVFASLILMVLMSGAGAYRGVASSLQQQYEERVCINYIAAKVRHYDTVGTVSVGEFAGHNALLFTEVYGDEAYQTAIYYHDGKVREIFCEAGSPPFAKGDEAAEAEIGETIIEAADLTFEAIRPDLLRIECTGSSGNTDSLLMSLRSEKEAA